MTKQHVNFLLIPGEIDIGMMRGKVMMVLVLLVGLKRGEEKRR